MAEATESNGPQGALQNGASSGNQLKMQRSGLTRAWRIERSCDPFYSGGKVFLLT